VQPDFQEKTLAFCKYFRPMIAELNELLSYNKIFIERTAGVGILPPEVAINYGVSGPVLRGSGVKWDLRKNDPYSVYNRFTFDIPVGKGIKGEVGDCWDRYMVRVAEMEQSVNIIEQAAQNLPAGDVQSTVPKRIRPEAGEVYARTETPKGDLGFYIVSDGTGTPYRIKVRPPCFVNLSAIPAMLRGAMIADVIAVLGSIDIVLGEVDR
jgi:NADH-quinone oxidoreductase subunit D